MHPIERLRYVARAGEDSPSLLVRESAGALASFSREPAALVTACRRLVDRQPHSAPVWWLAARVLHAPEPAREAWDAADEIDEDPTPGHVADALPEEATVAILGWPELTATALFRRADVEVFVVDANRQGHSLVRFFERSDIEATLVEERGVGSLAAFVDVLIIEAIAFGGEFVAAVPGALAAATVGHRSGKTVIAVVGRGRTLPGRMWDAYSTRLDDSADPWEAELELVPADLFTVFIGEDGPATANEILQNANCPLAPELFKALQ